MLSGSLLSSESEAESFSENEEEKSMSDSDESFQKNTLPFSKRIFTNNIREF